MNKKFAHSYLITSNTVHTYHKLYTVDVLYLYVTTLLWSYVQKYWQIVTCKISMTPPADQMKHNVTFNATFHTHLDSIW